MTLAAAPRMGEGTFAPRRDKLWARLPLPGRPRVLVPPEFWSEKRRRDFIKAYLEQVANGEVILTAVRSSSMPIPASWPFCAPGIGSAASPTGTPWSCGTSGANVAERCPCFAKPCARRASGAPRCSPTPRTKTSSRPLSRSASHLRHVGACGGKSDEWMERRTGHVEDDMIDQCNRAACARRSALHAVPGHQGKPSPSSPNCPTFVPAGFR